ncbi:hypothetical protein B0J13DRAFT_551001, partial [Dactylonectria estremocensis]
LFFFLFFFCSCISSQKNVCVWLGWNRNFFLALDYRRSIVSSSSFSSCSAGAWPAQTAIIHIPSFSARPRVRRISY